MPIIKQAYIQIVHADLVDGAQAEACLAVRKRAREF